VVSVQGQEHDRAHPLLLLLLLLLLGRRLRRQAA
jgi:MYXO-CTERM domain-containing protein